ncbi:transcriptional regulator [Halorubrum sp. JWXQ-INN 858]|uniref:winged helix-turn-helix transcriptional regulator n=1 Tax=Halorubrum sp. JWXQ-INN 858 TaxID=2690782 RepID=UPI00135AE344|nr:helix-turn-helix domain-containing protein [Halorubrum sp. JWXQ-INN 858]MWV64936.1 transcriptional regulator [Halorubrum sp. JWXQ-INN 858]
MSSPDLTGAEAEPDGATDGSVAGTETACPVVDSLEQIGSQWRLVVLHELQNGERRFNELKRDTDANARTLSRVLDDLQETEFVDRRLEEDSPVATYYSLTAKGESLAPVFEEIGSWANEWLAECDASADGREHR